MAFAPIAMCMCAALLPTPAVPSRSPLGRQLSVRAACDDRRALCETALAYAVGALAAEATAWVADAVRGEEDRADLRNVSRMLGPPFAPRPMRTHS
jgi:hypothetical protein